MLNNMNIVICDDEPLFVESLEREIRSYGASCDVAIHIRSYYSGETLLSSDLSACDLLFLDIDMPKMDGIEAATLLRKQYPNLLLIFVTGWIEYAPAGYRVNAFRYLLKKNIPDELILFLNEARANLFESSEMISIQTRDQTLEIAVKNIVFFEGTPRRVVRLHVSNLEEPIEFSGKLSDYAQQLAGRGFLRIQKSYLVNMNHIVKIRNYMAVLKDGRELKVSERQYAHVKKEFFMNQRNVI